MSKKLKIKINGKVSEGDIPNDVEDLELECRVIGKGALKGFENLRSVTLINTKIIGECAFESCKSLNKVKLPDTLLTIGSRNGDQASDNSAERQ